MDVQKWKTILVVQAKRLLFVATILANIIYVYWRMFYTIPFGYDAVTVVFGVSLFIVEFVGMFEMFVHFFGMSKSFDPPLPTIDDDLFPDVDVFIASYSESESILRKTINGCLRMQYPDRSKVHIYLCDDGDRHAMADFAHRMGVQYLRRDGHDGAKAGMLNHALAHTKQASGGNASPLIVTFDADMIPMHDFLLQTVPYFLAKEQAVKDGKLTAQEAAKYERPSDEMQPNDPYRPIGFVQTPQGFYNADLFQFNLFLEKKIPNEQDYFYRDIQLARNATNTVIYGGSNTVISRRAIADIGGFYTKSITEDFATGMLIQGQGYTCYATDDIHASGLSPTDLTSLVKQRQRWARGCIQTGHQMKLLLRKDLSIGQKVHYLSSISYWYACIKRFFYLMAPIMFAVFHKQVFLCTLPQVLMFWLPTYTLTALTLRTFSSKIRTTKWTNIYETIMFPPLLFSVIVETLGFTKKTFDVTHKDDGTTPAKSAAPKQAKAKRGSTKPASKKGSGISYQVGMTVTFGVFALLSVVGIINMVYYTLLYQTLGFIVVIFWLVTNLIVLGFCLLFLCGRKRDDWDYRFVASLPCHVRYSDIEFDTITEDISEKAFAFNTSSGIELERRLPFYVTFEVPAGDEVYKCELKVLLLKAKTKRNNTRYVARIVDLDEADIDTWCAIVHDRQPSLPQVIHDDFGLWDDIEENVTQRVKDWLE